MRLHVKSENFQFCYKSAVNGKCSMPNFDFYRLHKMSGCSPTLKDSISSTQIAREMYFLFVRKLWISCMHMM